MMQGSESATALVDMPGFVVGARLEVDGEWWRYGPGAEERSVMGSPARQRASQVQPVRSEQPAASAASAMVQPCSSNRRHRSSPRCGVHSRPAHHQKASRVRDPTVRQQRSRDSRTWLGPPVRTATGTLPGRAGPRCRQTVSLRFVTQSTKILTRSRHPFVYQCEGLRSSAGGTGGPGRLGTSKPAFALNTNSSERNTTR